MVPSLNIGIARWPGDSYTLSAASLRSLNRGSLSKTLAVRVFCSRTQAMERAAATSSSHWYLSACSREENVGEEDVAEPAAGVEEWQPVTIPRIAMVPRVSGPSRIRCPPQKPLIFLRTLHLPQLDGRREKGQNHLSNHPRGE